MTAATTATTLPDVIAARVRAERLHRGLSQRELAELARISERTLVNVELGGNPRASTVEAIAAGLQIDASELLSPS